MRKLKLILSLSLALLLANCSVDESNNEELNSNQIEISNANMLADISNDITNEKINGLLKDLDYEKTFLEELSPNFIENQYYEEAVYTDINSVFFNQDDQEFNVDAVAIYTLDNENSGIGIYSYFPSSKELYYSLFEQSEGKFILVEDFPKIVNNVDNKDLLYVANNYLHYSDTHLIVNSKDLYYSDLSKNFNDLSLERTVSSLSHPNIEVSQSCGFTFSCLNGGGGSCIPSGCLNFDWICKYSEVSTTVMDHDYTLVADNNFELELPEPILHDFRDNLDETKLGQKYVDIYYVVNNHFLESLSSEVIIKSIDVSADISEVVSKFNSSNANQSIYDNVFVDKVKDLLEESSIHSSSPEYKKAVPILINELDNYKNLTKSQLIAKFNE